MEVIARNRQRCSGESCRNRRGESGNGNRLNGSGTPTSAAAKDEKNKQSKGLIFPQGGSFRLVSHPSAQGRRSNPPPFFHHGKQPDSRPHPSVRRGVFALWGIRHD